jgi:hypothetical protein
MEAPAIVDLSASLVPLSIRHAELDLSWSVLAVAEDWTTPAYHDDVGTPHGDEAVPAPRDRPVARPPVRGRRVRDDRPPLRRPSRLVDQRGFAWSAALGAWLSKALSFTTCFSRSPW